MTVVSDAGPLIALAKIGGLEILHKLHPKILISPSVYRESVEAGLARSEPDAVALSIFAKQEKASIVLPQLAPSEVLLHLGAGERESILLAIEYRAEWLLIDDFEARQSAREMLQARGMPTRIRGTLGVIVAAKLTGEVSAADAITMIERIRLRPDIWISSALCDRVLLTLGQRSQ